MLMSRRVGPLRKYREVVGWLESGKEKYLHKAIKIVFAEIILQQNFQLILASLCSYQDETFFKLKSILSDMISLYLSIEKLQINPPVLSYVIKVFMIFAFKFFIYFSFSEVKI